MDGCQGRLMKDNFHPLHGPRHDCIVSHISFQEFNIPGTDQAHHGLLEGFGGAIDFRRSLAGVEGPPVVEGSSQADDFILQTSILSLQGSLDFYLVFTW